MQCPYCNNEMEKGCVKSSKHLFWGQKTDQGNVLEEFTRLSDLSLSGLFVGYGVDADFCPHCKKIIISLD